MFPSEMNSHFHVKEQSVCLLSWENPYSLLYEQSGVHFQRNCGAASVGEVGITRLYGLKLMFQVSELQRVQQKATLEIKISS